MLLTYRFHSFDFVTLTIFLKSSAILLITSFAAFFHVILICTNLFRLQIEKDQSYDHWDYIEKFENYAF